MPFPTTEQYGEAMQFPSKVLKDPELVLCKVETDGLGLPFQRTGGFALTYKMLGVNKNWALRVFHKDRPQARLAERYGAIERGIKKSGLPYFVDFKFLVAGISIQQQTYPAVKMQWAEGIVLGSYIEKNRKNKSALLSLRQSLQKMSSDMEKAGIAHGDLQTDNVLVAPSGALKFVDYDAFYVPEIKSLGALEEGYPNFQHPTRRSTIPYDEKLDRFSYLVIDTALLALIDNPALWEKTNADPQGLLVRASDFGNPETSDLFRTLSFDPKVGVVYRRLAAICKGNYSDVPILTDFLAGKGPAALNLKPISTVTSATSPQSQKSKRTYQSAASKVISADNYLAFVGAGGQFVELIGKIKSIDNRPTKYGDSKVFLLFGPKTGNCVYVPIWSEGLSNLAAAGKPVDLSAQGKWVSVTGTVTSYATASWSRAGITVVDSINLNFITEEEAQLRLSTQGSTISASQSFSQTASTSNRNSQIAAAARAAAAKPPTQRRSSSSSSRGSRSRPRYSSSSYGSSSYSPPPKKETNWVFWGIIIAFVVFVILAG